MPPSGIFYISSLLFFRPPPSFFSFVVSVSGGVMATSNLQFLISTFLFAALLIQGSATHSQLLQPLHRQGGFYSYPAPRLSVENGGGTGWARWSSRREMIGSTAPTCTYNECKGCKFRCRAEQIPVDASDPIHSAYRYKCVCHRTQNEVHRVFELLGIHNHVDSLTSRELNNVNSDAILTSIVTTNTVPKLSEQSNYELRLKESSVS